VPENSPRSSKTSLQWPRKLQKSKLPAEGPAQHVLYRSVFSSQESLCVGMQEVP